MADEIISVKVATTFLLTPFDAVAAESGALCVAAQEGRSKTSITTNGEHFYGAGICRQSAVSDRFNFTANGEVCIFTNKGLGYSSNAYAYENYEDPETKETKQRKVRMQLYMATLVKPADIKTAGGAIPTNYKTVVTRNDDGSFSSLTEVSPNTVLVDSLNARDHFAMQALRGLMEHMEDPAGMDDNKMYNYCRIAYKWAEVMMHEAANVRAIYQEGEQGQVDVDTTSLETNTEKLLYNIEDEVHKVHHAIIEVDGSGSLTNNNLAKIIADGFAAIVEEMKKE